MSEKRRIFVGGLFSGVTERELVQRFSRFGTVDQVEIKRRKDDTGAPTKTFAYVDGNFIERDLKKCISIYNKNMWKGSMIKLELAKESFLEKLKREIGSKDVLKEDSSLKATVPVTCKKDVKKAVPGTPLEGEKNWVIGKYGTALPIVYIRRRDKRKIAKMDPSKYCHNVKRMRNEEGAESSNVKSLTWELKENDSEVVKRRKGVFPEFKPKKRVKEKTTNVLLEAQTFNKDETNNHPALLHGVTPVQANSDFEIVKIQPTPEPMSLREKMLRIAGMFEETQEDEQDSDSDATGDIIASCRPTKSAGLPVEMQTSNSLCQFKGDTKSSAIAVMCDVNTGKNNEKKDKSILFSNKIISGTTLGDDRFSKDQGKTQSKMSQNSLKPFSFKGTMLLRGRSENCKPNKLATEMSHSDLVHENGDILPNRKSQGNSDIIPVCSVSRALSPIAMHGERTKNKAVVSGTKDEFSSGWIYRGEELVVPISAETSSSESDYDSEDYESLAARTPKLGSSRIGSEEAQMTKLVKKGDNVDNPNSGVHNKAVESEQNQSVRSSGVLTPDSSLVNKRGEKEDFSDTEEARLSGPGRSSEKDKGRCMENPKPSRKEVCKTGERSSLAVTLKSRKCSGVQSDSSLLDKHNTDNQKRLTSLRQCQKKAQSQKFLIQQSLKTVDSGSKSNKKTVFSSDEEEIPDPDTVQMNLTSEADKPEIKGTTNLEMGKEKTKLFDSSSDDSEDDLSDGEMFDVKAQFEGPAGERLMNLQSRYGNDPRFKLDHRFIESNESKGQKPIESTEEKSEMKKMIQILQDVVGHQVPVESDSKKLFKGPVRYDPTKDNHSKFEIKSSAKRQKEKIVDVGLTSPPKTAKSGDEDQKTVLPEVDKERYFEVSSSLKDAFGERSTNSSAEGFSLLASFGKVDARSVKPVEKKTETKEVLNVESQIKNLFDNDDSPGVERLQRGDPESSGNKTSSGTPKLGCFFTSDDPRLKEGVMAFSTNRDWSAIKEEWQENRPYWVESYRSIHKRVSRQVKGTRGKRGKRLNLTF